MKRRLIIAAFSLITVNAYAFLDESIQPESLEQANPVLMKMLGAQQSAQMEYQIQIEHAKLR